MLGADDNDGAPEKAEDEEKQSREDFLNIASAVRSVSQWLTTTNPAKNKRDSVIKSRWRHAAMPSALPIMDMTAQSNQFHRLRNPITTQTVQSLTALVNAMKDRGTHGGDCAMIFLGGPSPSQQQRRRPASSISPPASPLSPRSPRTYLANPSFVGPAPVDSL
jgi:hypothetical protein